MTTTTKASRPALGSDDPLIGHYYPPEAYPKHKPGNVALCGHVLKPGHRGRKPGDQFCVVCTDLFTDRYGYEPNI